MQSKAQKAKSQTEVDKYINWDDYGDGQGNNVCSGDASMHELKYGELVKSSGKKS